MSPNRARLLSLLRSLTLRDRVMLINMLLYFLVGGTLLFRAFFRHAAWPAYLIGILFLLAGGHRFYFIYKVFMRSPGPEGSLK